MAVMIRGLAVDPSAHRSNVHRVSADVTVAEKLTEQLTPAFQANVTGAVYAPFGQPDPEIVSVTGAALLMVVAGLKFAVTARGAFIVTVTGFVVPEAPPDQPVTRYPALGVAVNCTAEPAV